ncbi:excinuclease ABC subunit UvrC [Tepidibacter formicigenes]|jgi:excinuclease ABC subunit C|uniref:UvrABC system protein C n=1 Tax=Tepidibacter formicigenes DSM 15518 TaxID=1123349 RepID=A0A1M6Q8E5_9FIRM|nr:excinuclease ABC subunit UvrC [Tepidibacter formicigenes]SHK16471.1 Excinuclease ABC subunit C [Tepidibacter formicigenes DSM 15518]
MFDIKEQLKNLPELPGVYIMKDKYKNVIYVGKAISLKNRVRQYFQASKNHPRKVKSMVKNIAEFEYIITDSEVEALILECNLIKEYRPKYNVLLRDDKTYPYIKITLNEDYPRVLKVRKIKKDGSKYFGPYTNTSALNDTLELIHQMYLIRTCNLDIQKAIDRKQRPCLNFHINKCIGPCTGNIDKNEYKSMINEIIMILSGKIENLKNELQEKMQEASKKLEFEKAAKYRDKIISLEKMIENQKIVSTNNRLDQDVIAMAKAYDGACVQVFFIRNGKIVGREHYIIENVLDSERNEILSSFIKQFYSFQRFIPRELIIEEEIEDMEIIQDWLSYNKNKRVNIKVPKKGEKKELVEMVRKNAIESLEKFKNLKKIKFEKTRGVLEELKEILNLDKKPIRIEAFDISNIQGVDSVGSMVVFTNGKKDRKEYRRFKINTVIGPNDYASMEEIISRRFKNGNYPDLILLDGGLGQVGVVDKVLKRYNLSIPLWGMYKDNKHRTKGLVSLEKEIEFDKYSNIYKFIAAIQEEVHRFAISYHRSLREKNMTKSILDDIPNVGKKRKMNLLSRFKTIENIKNASIHELEKVEGMNKKVAQSVYNYFRKKG